VVEVDESVMITDKGLSHIRLAQYVYHGLGTETVNGTIIGNFWNSAMLERWILNNDKLPPAR
jgi:hypothetical protein